MYSVIIADDDFAVRATLKDVVDWNALGFEIVGEATNGKNALNLIESMPVQLLITDMKMPVMDGIELIREIEHKEIMIVAISSFDEYDLVRESFKLGVEDYFLKTNLEENTITTFLKRVRMKLDAKCLKSQRIEIQNVLKDFLDKSTNAYDDGEAYSVILIDLSNEQKAQNRFKNLHEDLILPMEELILQMPSLIEHCEYAEHSDVNLILRYHGSKVSNQSVHRICGQIHKMLKNYMNLEVTIGASDVYIGAENLKVALEEATKMLSQRYVFGESKIYELLSDELLDLKELEKERNRYVDLLKSFRDLDNEALLRSEEILFANMQKETLDDIKKLCLYMIYLEGIMLKGYGESLWNAFGKSVSYPSKLERLVHEKDCIMWMYNFNRFLFDYLHKSRNNKGENTFEIVRRYIMDNYADSNLNLAEVASLAGLNESYFSAKFKKEFGTNFSDYLKEVRINHAKRLMETTNLKIYEVSQAVGYRNVEHFTRIFKSYVGVTPKQYMK